ncbi:hypothetical protein NESM_000461000 [Novymonas esmeraldas]|uniref:Uncharacterized protein n=1 Tax=Novymonas esmeraldas TaxID=1808958 RepID=A0AAW0ENQ6_9TRYP
MEPYDYSSYSEAHVSPAVSYGRRRGNGASSDGASTRSSGRGTRDGACLATDKGGDSSPLGAYAFDTESGLSGRHFSSGSNTSMSVASQYNNAAVAVPTSEGMRRLSAVTTSSPQSESDAHVTDCGGPFDGAPRRLHVGGASPTPQVINASVAVKPPDMFTGGVIAKVLQGNAFSHQQPQVGGTRFNGAQRVVPHFSNATSLPHSYAAGDFSGGSNTTSVMNGMSAPVMPCGGGAPYSTGSMRGMAVVLPHMDSSRRSSTVSIGGGGVSYTTMQQQRQSYDRFMMRMGSGQGNCGMDYTQPPLMGSYPAGYTAVAPPQPFFGGAPSLYGGAHVSGAPAVMMPDMRAALPHVRLSGSSRRGSEMMLPGSVRGGDHGGGGGGGSALYQQTYGQSFFAQPSGHALTTDDVRGSGRGFVEENSVRPFSAVSSLAGGADASSLYDMPRQRQTQVLAAAAPPSSRPMSTAERSLLMESVKSGVDFTDVSAASEPHDVPRASRRRGNGGTAKHPHDALSARIPPSQPAWLEGEPRVPLFSSYELVSPVTSATQLGELGSGLLGRPQSLRSCAGTSAATDATQQRRPSTRSGVLDRIASKCSQLGRDAASGIQRGYRNSLRSARRGSDEVEWLKTTASSKASESTSSTTSDPSTHRDAWTPPEHGRRHANGPSRTTETVRSRSTTSSDASIALRRSVRVKALSVDIIGDAIRERS